MPITKSAKKALRKDRRKKEINAKLRQKMKQAASAWKKSATAKNVKAYISVLDKAVKKNLIHKNKASRLKSAASKKIKTK